MVFHMVDNTFYTLVKKQRYITVMIVKANSKIY